MLFSAAIAPAAEVVTRPFVGVTYIARTETSPRLLKMHVVDIDLAAPGLRFRMTPHSGAMATIKQTTLAFLTDQHAQIAINAHFFEPWPPPSPDPGAVDLVGIAASDGDVYSPFTDHPPKPYAIAADAPGLNIGPDNRATIIHRSVSDASGRTAAEGVTLYNALCGNGQIVTGGEVAVAGTKWNSTFSPRTVIGLTRTNHLILLVVDGRQKGVSEGLSVAETAKILRDDYAVTEALGLDGGGSSTLAMADPLPRVVNVPVGVGDKPGTLRAVGSNLAVFAITVSPDGSVSGWMWCALAVVAVCIGIGIRTLMFRRGNN